MTQARVRAYGGTRVPGTKTAFTQTNTTVLTTVPADLAGNETLAQTQTRLNDAMHLINALIDQLQAAGIST
jgi:hypothetical protein